ncbi:MULTISPECIES: DUF397 domain-containing protein [unclassified Streptomyces]|uniref:DUF397 domain-containing protein n=1 Tax=unclassified Streptomyces TaxID=2593676 RepID=UPI001CA6C49F|nr:MULTISPECIES: DUF397 domain-containing protein [unclassified Streptomyces]MBY8845829.1 DUF397 domain-containing protein [Streptomyces sp. SP2-10]
MSVQHSKPAVPEAAWIKSSYSTGNGGECVEVATVPGAVLVRDSKRPAVARLAFGSAAWDGFVRMAARR